MGGRGSICTPADSPDKVSPPSGHRTRPEDPSEGQNRWYFANVSSSVMAAGAILRGGSS